MRRLLSVWLLISVFFLAGCGDNDQAPGGSGLVEATQTLVSAEVMGQVQRLLCQEGDQLMVADTIALIDTVNLALQLRQAEAGLAAGESQRLLTAIDIERAQENLTLAQKEFERLTQLLPTGSANQQQYDRAENQLAQAKLNQQRAAAALTAIEADIARLAAQAELVRQQLADCAPLAPVCGVVVKKYVEVGELVAPGKPLIEIAQLDTVWVKVYLPPQELTKISLDDRAEVDPEDGRAEPLTGRISWISAEAEFTPKNVQTREARADLVYAVKVAIPNPEQTLKIGMPVAVRIQ